VQFDSKVVPDMGLTQIHNIFRQLGLKCVMVVSHGKLQGMLTKKSFVKHMHTVREIEGEMNT
jgi:hypothetical protein